MLIQLPEDRILTMQMLGYLEERAVRYEEVTQMLDAQTLSMIGKGIIETLYMVIVSTACAYAIGLPIGLILVILIKMVFVLVLL